MSIHAEQKAVTVATPDAAHFAAPQCQNCGADLHTPFCPQCGQKRVERIGSWQLGQEVWNKFKWFDANVVVSARRLLRRPGAVAREYVFGARKRHLNPIKLLLVGIGFLVLIVQRSNYLASANAPVSSAMAIVQAWANLSFSLSVVAIVLATWVFYRKCGGFNLFEHLILACYIQFVVVVVSVLTKLPTLIWPDAAFLAQHRLVSSWLLDLAGLLIFFSACRQFFLIDIRHGWVRLLGASVIFLCCKWILVRLYALILVSIVLSST
ncbi:MAG: DUF3667 domain-containing protein [Dokdonella sp.]